MKRFSGLNSKSILSIKKITIVSLLYFCNILVAQDNIESDTLVPNHLFTIDNCVNEFNMDSVIQTKVGYQYWFVDKNFLDGRTLKMSVVKPGTATHPPHVHAEDEFFFILEGKAEFYLNGETKAAEAYASFYCPANSKHGIRNIGNTTLKYLVIKKYNLK